MCPEGRIGQVFGKMRKQVRREGEVRRQVQGQVRR